MKSYIKTNNSLCDIPIKLDTTQTVSVEDGQISIVNNAIYMYDDSQSQWECISSNGSNSNVNSSGIIGEIIAYYGSTNPDSDIFVPCDGSTYDTTKFSELYALLGTNTTPDLTNFTLVGDSVHSSVITLDKCCCVGDFSGPLTGSDCMPYHTHDSCILAHTHTLDNGVHCHRYCCCIGSCYRSGTGRYVINTGSTTILGSGSANSGTTYVCICKTCFTNGSWTIGLPNSTTLGGTVRIGGVCKGKTKSVRFFMRGKA